MTTDDNPAAAFQKQVADNIRKIGEDSAFLGLSNIWSREAIRYSYALNFSWLGRPVIQTPLDLYAYQELIWTCRPDLVVETGIAHGGSLIMSASILALLDYCDAIKKGGVFDPKASRRKVVGVDIERIQVVSFAVGFAAAAVAGTLISMEEAITPFMGFPFTIAAFVVIIMGGLGNISGGVGAALVLGVIETYGVAFTSSTFRSILLYGVFVAILLLRPQGLFSSAGKSAR